MSLNLARATNSTSNIVTLFAWDTVAKRPITGLLYNTSDLVVYTALNQAAAASIGTLVDMTEGTFTSLGFKEKASLPGFYDVGVPNTKFASVTGELLITARITSDDTIVFQPVCIPILPASAYATTVDANVTKWSGTNVASPDTAGYPKVTLKSGTGAGELSLSGGTVTTGALSNNAITASAIASNAITAAKIATDAIGAAQVAADAVTEIQSGLATAAAVSTLTGYVDTEVAAIKAKTDNLPASPAAVSDIPSTSAIATAVWGAATRSLTTFGSLASDVWASGTRTLTSAGSLATDVRDGLLTWEPFTGYSLARLFRVLFATQRGTVTGATGTNPTINAPDNSGAISATIAGNGDRSAVSDSFSNVP